LRGECGFFETFFEPVDELLKNYVTAKLPEHPFHALFE